jgi:signal transduction histidine kinase
MMRNAKQRWRGWLEIGAMLALCGILGALQYRWIGEVSVAERERLQASLQTGLARLSQDFNEEISVLCRAIMRGDDSAYLARLKAWQETGRHIGMLRGAFVARPLNGDMQLLRLKTDTASEEVVPWPAEWDKVRRQMLARLAGDRGRGGVSSAGDLTLIDLPRFPRGPGPMLPPWPDFGPRREPGPRRDPGPRPDGPGMPAMREIEWVLLDMDAQYLATVLVPELLARHLGEPAAAEYLYGVYARHDAARLIAGDAVGRPDAQVALFQPQFETIFRRGGGGGPSGRRGGPPPNMAEGRWTLAVRNEAGSLEGVVARTRWRNLAVTGGILGLLLAAVGIVLRTTRESQRLAEMQIDFVAGVSHELRTPLTVIRTAAYNLRGKIAANPAQVERYGGLIQQESEKLTALVEQVMQYASARAGKTIQAVKEPVAIESLVEACGAANEALLRQAGCELEVRIGPGLPLVLGDALALERAVNNLLANAAKYGADGKWVGLFAEKAPGGVAIHVADRGAGIPAAEQAHVFDAFFRGRRAVEDQVHGTGLGLNLVKGIVEAHGGTVTVKSAPGKGSEFEILLPAAPDGYQDEFTDSISGR